MAYSFSDNVKFIPGHHNTPTYDISRDLLVNLFNDLGNWADVARSLDVSKTTISRYVKKFDIKVMAV